MMKGESLRSFITSNDNKRSSFKHETEIKTFSKLLHFHKKQAVLIINFLLNTGFNCSLTRLSVA